MLQRSSLDAPFGSQGIRPSLITNFTDFIDKGFAFDWEESTYTIKPMFLREWLDRYSLHVIGRRFNPFDSLLQATLTYFIVCVKIAERNTPLDLREELQGIAVPTYMQDGHAAFPIGGRVRSQPFEFLYVFDPVWTGIFLSNVDYFVGLLRQDSRQALGNGWPTVGLDFDVFHNQTENMIVDDVANDGNPVQVQVRDNVNPFLLDDAPVEIEMVQTVTIRYGSDSQLQPNWQTTYFTWFSIETDTFEDLYGTLPKYYELTRDDLGGFLNIMVTWYVTTRGGASPVPNFSGSGGGGNNQGGPQPTGGSGPNPNPGGGGGPNNRRGNRNNRRNNGGSGSSPRNNPGGSGSSGVQPNTTRPNTTPTQQIVEPTVTTPAVQESRPSQQTVLMPRPTRPISSVSNIVPYTGRYNSVQVNQTPEPYYDEF